jgi:hypothetical protein
MSTAKKLYRLAGGGYVIREGRHLTPVLFYPHDGELENGGVVVDPNCRDRIFLLVRGKLIRAELAAQNQAHQKALQDSPFDSR